MNKEELAEGIRKSVEWLRQADNGCVTLKLNDILAVCVGWQNGFDEDDESIIHSKSDPTWGIVCGIKAYNTDNMRTDYDYISSPFSMKGNVYDTTTSVPLDDKSFERLVDYQWEEYEILSKFKIEKNGEVLSQLR